MRKTPTVTMVKTSTERVPAGGFGRDDVVAWEDHTSIPMAAGEH